MDKKNYNVIGVMSGTSLDGIDCAYSRITLSSTNCSKKYPSFSTEIHTAQTIPYPQKWKGKLASAHNLSKEELHNLNRDYTIYLASIINSFISTHKLRSIDFVCSHGHTVLHNPKEGYTLQIGNLPEIATLLGQKVICDFRVQDVAMGGQGAPLVPIGDALLYANYDYCLNLGGFANISKDMGGTRVAYDICPVNVVLNTYAQKLGRDFDAGGTYARSGNVHPAILERLNALSFYEKDAPKSLGIEWVHQHIFPLLEEVAIVPEDVLATFTKHIAMQILAQFESGSNILVTGGGAYNEYLMDLLRFRESISITIPDPMLIEFKEALIFGLLGVLKVEGLANCLASVTGAKEDHSSGIIYES